MSEATRLATAAANRDPKIGLGAVAALRRLLDQLETVQVYNARARGWSWQQIASELGVTRQAVHKKHTGPRPPRRRRARVPVGQPVPRSRLVGLSPEAAVGTSSGTSGNGAQSQP